MFMMETGLIVAYNTAQVYGSQYGVQEEGFQAATIGGMMLSHSVGAVQSAAGMARSMAGTVVSLGKGVAGAGVGLAKAPAKFSS
jgi:hypothetical protein